MSSRRKFLQVSAATGAAVLLGKIGNYFPANLQPSRASDVGRKLVMVIDLARCDGCAECTEACIDVHLVPNAWSEPSFKGTADKPEHKGRQEWIKVHDLKEDLGPPGRKGNFLPALCYQCENAPCVNVCPVGATYHNQDGLVLIDHTVCIGCRFCMAACPYERRYFNWGDPSLSYTEEEKARLAVAQYSPEYPVPHQKGTVEKCMFCAHNIEHGKLPACVQACTDSGMKAIYFGDALEDVVTNGAEVLKLSELLKSRGAHRLKEELGTKPRLYYLPPGGE